MTSPRLRIRVLLGGAILAGAVLAAPARSADVTVSYAHRYLPNGGVLPPAGIEASIVATFVASEPVNLAEPDTSIKTISPTEFETRFPWNWAAPKTVAFVTASGDTLTVVAAPKPRWAFDPARHAVPVLNVRTDSTNLWDPDTGIYVWGNHQNFLQEGEEWERSATFDYYDIDHELAVAEPIGLRIHGQSSRYLDQKSLRFYFDDYGSSDDVDYDFFGSTPTMFRRLIVRQARRPIFAINHNLANGIFADLGHLTARGRFCVVYLNGEYWGGYTLHERYDDEFVEKTHALADDDYILVKDGAAEHGDIAAWWSFLESFGESGDFASHARYVSVDNGMDLASYIDWLLINIYCGSADNGFDRNVALLRVADGQWRILLWDEDSLLYAANTLANHFRFYAAEDRTEYTLYKPVIFPFPWTPEAQRWCTMFNRLMRNVEFRTRFMSRARELLEGDLSVASLTGRLDALAAEQGAEMQGDHVDRWGAGSLSYAEEIERSKNWVAARRGVVLGQLADFFEHFAEPVELSSFSAEAGAGRSDLTWRTEREVGNRGFIVYRALGPGGFVPIASWETSPELVGQGTTSAPTTYAWSDPAPVEGALHAYVLHHVDAADSVHVHPWLETVDLRSWDGLVLNEIVAANTAGTPDGQGDFDPWIELLNMGLGTVQLDSLRISGDSAPPQRHQLTGGLALAPGERLLLWGDGEPEEGTTHLDFRLSETGGRVTLSTPAAAVLDSVTFGRQLADRAWERYPDGTGTWTYAADPSPSAPNLPPALPRFAVLNEIQSENVTTVMDEAGDPDPWAELANPLPVPIPLAGLHLTFAPEDLSGFALPDIDLDADGHLLLWLDGEPGEGALHATSMLPGGGGFVGLTFPAQAARVDSVTFSSPGIDASRGRLPDAIGSWAVPVAPTPGARNPSPLPALFVNEFLASNQTGLRDEAGEFEDWVEIWNPGPDPVPLGGLHLTDDLENPTKWTFPDTTLAPRGYLVVWCDEDPQDGPLHASFKLGASGEEIGLFGGPEHLTGAIDTHVFGAQSADVSEGRESDGGLPWVFLDPPTPGTSNAPGLSAPLAEVLPRTLLLLPAHPNPFSRSTAIRFFAPRPGWARADLIDISGRRVVRLLNERITAGPRELSWDGRDRNGRRAASGIYFLRLEVDGERRIGRIVRVR